MDFRSVLLVAFVSILELTPAMTITYHEERVIGNRDLVFDNSSKEEFQPFSSVSMALTALQMTGDGEISELGFYASETLPVEIGIYRPEPSEDCTRRSTFTKIYVLSTTPSSIGPVVFNLEPSVAVKKCDVLGFYNINPSSLVVGRVGVGGIGDNPYMVLGATEINQPANFIMYIRGYEYAIYAVLAAAHSNGTTQPQRSSATTTTITPATATTTTTNTTRESQPQSTTNAPDTSFPQYVIIIIVVIAVAVAIAITVGIVLVVHKRKERHNYDYPEGILLANRQLPNPPSADADQESQGGENSRLDTEEYLTPVNPARPPTIEAADGYIDFNSPDDECGTYEPRQPNTSARVYSVLLRVPEENRSDNMQIATLTGAGNLGCDL